MIDWVENKLQLLKDSDDYNKIRSALQRTTKHPQRSESNYDYEGIKFDPKLTSYNSALL
jgi:hypothetical protein